MRALRSSLTTFALALLAALLLGAPEASAAAFLWVPTGSGDFDVVANWADKNTGNPPPQPLGGGSEGIFHDTQDNILVFNGGTWNMSVTEDLRGARVGANNSGSPATGTLNILPGSATWRGLTIGDEWNWLGNNGVGLYEISGGSLALLGGPNGPALAVGDNAGTGSGTFRVVGSGAASITADDVVFQSPGVFDVTIDSGGVTAVNATGQANFHAGSLLRLTPAPGTPAETYTVMTYGSLNATHQNLALAPGTNTDRWSFNLGATALTVTNAYPASLLLVDNFNDNLLDSVRWVALDPEDFDVTGTDFPGGARVEEVNQRIEIDNRGHLRTAQEFNPAELAGPLRIRGEASWPATDGADQFHLIVRGSGEPNDRLGAAAAGRSILAPMSITPTSRICTWPTCSTTPGRPG
jgi:hypothetical protein